MNWLRMAVHSWCWPWGSMQFALPGEWRRSRQRHIVLCTTPPRSTGSHNPNNFTLLPAAGKIVASKIAATLVHDVGTHSQQHLLGGSANSQQPLARPGRLRQTHLLIVYPSIWNAGTATRGARLRIVVSRVAGSSGRDMRKP
jgi:hypothetical protein